MKFYTKIFELSLNRPSIKFLYNLFFFKSKFSNQLNHIKIPHIFTPFKYLKIKIFKNSKQNIYLSYYYFLSFFITIVIIFIY